MLVSALVGLLSSEAGASETRYFRHADERYLLEDQRNGGAALLPEHVAPGAKVPLVVFLHGTNSSAEPHLWLGGGSRDLRPVASRLMKEGQVRPFVLAAPSQTRGAVLPRELWNGFDLGAFVDDVVEATEDSVGIDRRLVVVAGHSGAGCNPTGGLATNFASPASVRPLAIASIDPCLDAEMGGAFSRRATDLPLLVWWQSAVWARDPERFWAALTAHKPDERVDRMIKLPARTANPHDAIVPLAFEHMLRELLPSNSVSHDDEVSLPK